MCRLLDVEELAILAVQVRRPPFTCTAKVIELAEHETCGNERLYRPCSREDSKT